MFVLQNMAIKHKLIWIIMLTCITALVLAGVAFIGWERATFRSKMVHSLSTQAEMIAENCKAALAFQDAEDAKQTLQALRVEPSIVFGCVYNKDSKLFATYYRDYTEIKLPPSEFQESGFSFSEGFLTVFKPIVLDGEVVGTVCLRSDMSPMYAMFKRNTCIIIAVLFFSSLAAFLVSSRLQKIISEPILSLAEVAKVVSEKKDYSTRALKQSSDEVGLLIDAFNEMLEQIQLRDSELVDAKEQLEVRVEQRTAELTTANERLTREVAERKKAEEETKQSYDIQAVISKLLSLSLENISLEDMLERAIDDMTSIPWFALEPMGAIFLVEDEPEVLVMKAQRGLPKPLQTTCARVPFGKCICGRAASSGEIVFADCVDERHERRYEGISPHGHYCVPILSAGKVLGVIDMYAKEGHHRSDKEKNFLSGVAAMLAGIIERKKAEQALERLNRNLEAANQELGRSNKELQDFAHIVSHDLKAPLRGIKTLANWISTDYTDKLDENGREQIELLLSRVDRMHNLIDGILQYSRVGRIKEEASQVNLNELVPDIIDMVAPPESITITVENELPVIECEKTRIVQVFQNLLSNAVKYMDKLQGQIRIGCVEENGFWKFSVVDNGPGIEERHFEKIFQIFQTLSPRDEVESTGVGLTLVKKIVEMHGGQIWVESKMGQGSTFFFTLPKQKVGGKNEKLQASIVSGR
ncbi:MAG: ATP-binding protein [Sedimentisphaerales bacterium]